MPHFMIIVIQFIKPFSIIKMSIFADYGAFKEEYVVILLEYTSQFHIKKSNQKKKKKKKHVGTHYTLTLPMRF